MKLWTSVVTPIFKLFFSDSWEASITLIYVFICLFLVRVSFILSQVNYLIPNNILKWL